MRDSISNNPDSFRIFLCIVILALATHESFARIKLILNAQFFNDFMQTARDNYISWDECFMRMAHVIAERSKDPSTQAGALIATPDNVVVGLGYNGFPRGVDNDELPWEREGGFLDTKYAYVCHAEENAVYNANVQTKGCKLYCTLYPCNECAKTIIQNGIKEHEINPLFYRGSIDHLS